MKSCPWPHSPMMQAHLNPETSHLARSRPACHSTHGARISAHGHRGSCTQTTSLSSKQAPLPYTPHSRSTIPAPEPHVTDSYQRPHLRTDASLVPPIPFQSPEKQYYKAGKADPHAPDSSARISDCRKACDRPADVKFIWPYHHPCIDMAEIIGRADWMS